MKNSNSPVVFIVEDDVFYANALSKTLSPYYDRIQVYGSGKEVLSAKGQVPDVVLLDYWLGDLNAFLVMRKLKEINPGVRIILVSGEAKLEAVVQALKQGAHDYIGKDEGLSEAVAVVGKALNTSEPLHDQPKKREVLMDRRTFPLLAASFMMLVVLLAKLIN